MSKAAAQMKPMCPKCGRAETVVAIAYGYPDPRLGRQTLEAGVALGGNVAAEHSPSWYCRACETSFGDVSSAA